MYDMQHEETLIASLAYQQAHVQLLADEEREPPPSTERRSQKSNKKLNALTTYTAFDLQQKEFSEPECVVENILPVGLSILAGVPKGGKSWMGLGFGLAKACGGIALDKIRVSCGDVLYLALEDSPRRLQSRINQLLGPEESAPQRLHITHSAPRIGEGLIEVLDDWCAQHSEAQLIEIDTLARVRKPKGRGADIYAEDSAAAAELQKLALRRNVAILVVHHVRKMENPDPVAMVSGSFGLTGAADAVLVLKRGRGSKDATLSVTGRDIEERELALTFEHGFWKLMGDAAEVRRSQERQAIMQLLRKPPPLTPKQVAELTGKNYSAVKKLLWKMSQDSELTAIDGKYTLNTDSSGNPGHSGNRGNPGNPVTHHRSDPPLGLPGYLGDFDPVTQNSEQNSQLESWVTAITQDEEGDL
jgi:hypothetical protein